jgi:hypothetical protein
MPDCYLCGGEAEEADYCHGCEEYICEECDEGKDFPIADHKPEDHGK